MRVNCSIAAKIIVADRHPKDIAKETWVVKYTPVAMNMLVRTRSTFTMEQTCPLGMYIDRTIPSSGSYDPTKNWNSMNEMRQIENPAGESSFVKIGIKNNRALAKYMEVHRMFTGNGSILSSTSSTVELVISFEVVIFASPFLAIGAKKLPVTANNMNTPNISPYAGSPA